ncbi:hypothetical protein [Amycolatopsis keratiniphila]|uniref:Uncharacterized protein n=1 Tax=Amycolatopsis keratiniphila TaxID=129921 RepID=R4T9P9_9PSEU|nr:hypothetical protein [Amycolatopsis keratiniphila]AGM07248.1 hypothetical protein AORI_4664 [Amycolatopsis keratiniphila]
MSRKRRLENLVSEIEERDAALTTALANVREQTIEVDIPDELGVVEVSGAGRLERIEIDLDNLPYTTAQALSENLLEAIVAAEEHAQELRQQTLTASRPR